MMKPIFLSAGVPWDDPARPESREYLATADRDGIREAVLALVRVVLPQTQLVYGGQPGITPFIAQLAKDEGLSDQVIVYQSEVFRKFYPESLWVFRGIRFIEAGVNQDKSLEAMRKAMLQEGKPDSFAAAFFIGGMNGVEDEYKLMGRFQQGTPRFVVGSTGGAALRLAQRGPTHPLEHEFWAELSQSQVYANLFRRILIKLKGSGPIS